MALVNDLAKSIQILNNQIEGILRPLDYESDNIILNDENPDQRFLRNEYGCRRQVEFYTFCSFPFYTSAENMLFRFLIR